MDTDRNLLFGVLALQADLIDNTQFALACSEWATRKDTPLAELLVQRSWLTPSDRADVEKLLQRKLDKHAGDAKAGLAEVTTDQVRESLAGIADPDVRQSLAGPTTPPQGLVLLATTAHVPEQGERYTLSRLHATGGIGRVWLARDASLGRDVALKELRPERADQPALWARFLREAQVTGQLEHPGIVPVYEVGRRPDDQAPFYTMRFVRGRTLAEAARAYHERRRRGEAGPLELRELLSAFVGVCHAVAYAHSRGVLHRDLKPQNVVLGDYGEVIVLDWGLAKVIGQPDGEAKVDRAPVALAGEGSRDETVAGQVLGTPAYMAPEQAEGRLDLLDARTDAYGLGAVLYAVLAGQPPFGGGDTTAVLRRVVHDAPAPPRSVVPGVPRPLEAVCLKALAKRPDQRYASALDLAEDVKRFLADEPVTAYRDPWTTRLTRWGRRHRTLAAALAVALLAALAGLAAVLAVQHRANSDLAAKNTELAERQAEVEARFETAQKAIATFHTGVSEEALLKNDSLKELRTKLLKEAASFYGDLEKLLQGKTDPKSRKLLASGYAQLGTLTEKIGDQREALAVQRKALAIRQALAAQPGADVETRLDVARSLQAVGTLMGVTGDPAGALGAYGEARDIAVALEAESPTNEARDILAQSYNDIGVLLSDTGKPAEALASYEKARDIRQKLADANPAVTQFQHDLARSHNNIGVLLLETGKPAEALASYEKARDIRQKLADSNPTVTQFQRDLARIHNNIGVLLAQTGKAAESLAAYEKARDMVQKLADANPAVTQFQSDLARSHNSIGTLLAQTGKPTEALAAFEKARDIVQKLADANPAVTQFQNDLAGSHHNIGVLLSQTGKPGEALAAFEKARDIVQKLADANPAVTQLQNDLAQSHFSIGWQLSQTGKPAESLAAYVKARDIVQKLADANPTVTQFQRDLAANHHNIGNLLCSTGKSGEALAPYEKARDILQKLADANPAVTHFQSDLAQSHNNIGVTLSELGKPAEALAAFEKARDILQKLADANPAVTQFQSVLASSHSNIGWQLSQTGRPAESLAAYEKARDIVQKLADANPAVTQFQSDLARNHDNIGARLSATGKRKKALESYRRALEIRQKLADANPTTHRYQADLAASHNNIGLLLAQQKQFGEAIAALETALVIGQRLADAHPTVADYTIGLGSSHSYRGWTHVRAGQRAGAAADLKRAVELWAKVKAPSIAIRFERSRALALLTGLGADAKSDVTATEAKAFADQAVAALQDAVIAGWGQPEELREPDFDAIRGREDFKKLLVDLEKNARK